MMGAMDMPDYPAEIYGYQSVIGTGNCIAAWVPSPTLERSFFGGLMDEDIIEFGLYVPPHPHPLLCPEANEGYGRLRAAYDQCKRENPKKVKPT